MNFASFPPPLFPHSKNQETLFPTGLTWSAAAVLFLIIHLPHDAVVAVLNGILEWTHRHEIVHAFLASLSGKYARSSSDVLLSLAEYAIIVPLKKASFIVSIALLLVPIITSLRRTRWIWEPASLRRRINDAAVLWCALAILVVPRFLQGFGDAYATMSLSPFTEGYGIFYRRFLMPSLAHVVGASGYVYYFLFSLLVTYCLVFALRLWLEAYNVERSFLFSLSLMTCSFVMFNFQLPGYPEQIVFILVLLCSIAPMSAQARIAAVALALSTHEAAALVVFPAAWFLFPSGERYRVLILLLLYVTVALAGHSLTDFRFMGNILSEATWNTPRHHFVDHPMHALQGVFFGYKFFWAALVVAIVFAVRKKMFQVVLALTAIVIFPLVLIPIASDASRLAGFGFMGLLIALLIIESNRVLTKRHMRTLAIANLVLPSCYVDLHSGLGMQLLPGAYKLAVTAFSTVTTYIVG